jgi:HPt (histidine-containing phosphotransfer) domain-containing protein
MTAHAMLGDQGRCRKAGMNDYVAKPVTPQALARMLEKWLLPKNGTPPEAERLPPSDPGGGAADALPAPAVWDRADLLSRLMDDHDLLKEIVREFLADSPRLIRLLNEFVAQGDLAGAERQAHSFKGSSANVGGEALRRTASEIELAARAGNRDRVQSLLPELDTQFARLQQAMQAASQP